MEIIKMKVSELIEYENNPRNNDSAVDAVAESIKQCGYIAPIIVDESNVILAGHTRKKALEKLGIDETEVVIKEGLSEEQKKKYRLLDNKTNEFAEWDFEKLEAELAELDFEGFDFGWGEKIDIEELNEREDLSDKVKTEFSLIIDCEDEADMESKYNMLQEMGIECRTSTL